MRNKFNNTRKVNFLKAIPDTSLDSGEITEKCKFNFSYFDGTQEAGQDYSGWSYEEILKLADKFKNYTNSSLDYWRHQRVGGGGLKVFEVYGKFPTKSDFTHPKHVPHDVQWARFRLENMVRLVGFIIPRGFACQKDVVLKEPFDSNTFYIVFLDKNHRFYLTEDP